MHQNQIQNELLFFYETLFRNTSANTSDECERTQTKFLFPNQIMKMPEFEGDLNELKLLKALKSMQINRSSGNDGLTKQFYETF